MADNTRGGSQDGSDPLIASDEVTYSGDTADVQLMRPVHVTGAEGSKTVVDLTTAEGATKVAGDTANDAADAGNPVKIGGHAYSGVPGAVSATNDRVDAAFSLRGAIHAMPVDINGNRAAHLEDGALGSATGVVMVGARRDDALSALTPVEDDAVGLRVDANGALWTKNSGTVTVDGSGVTQPVSGTVTVNALPAGTNNIGDVDVLTVPAPLSTTGGGTEATAHRVTIANDSTGVLSVDDNGSTLSVDDGGGVLTVDGTVGAAGDIAHDAADSGNPVKIGGKANAAAPTDVSANNDRVDAWFLRNGAQATVVTAAGALVGGDATNGLDVDVTRLPALVAGTANIGDVDVLTLPADPLGANADAVVAAGATGSISAKLRRATQGLEDLKTGIVLAAGTNNVGDVDVLTLPAIPAGTNNIGDVDVLTLPGVAGDVAHDAADSGNPVKVGAKAINALPTAVANNDRTNNVSDLFGRQLTAHIDPAMQVWKSYNDTSSRAAGSAQVVWDPTSGKKIAVTNLVIASYGTTAGRIFLFFADDADLTYTAGTDQPLFVGSFAPSATSKPGAVLTYAVPVVCTTADRRLHYQNDAAISVDITIFGYEW